MTGEPEASAADAVRHLADLASFAVRRRSLERLDAQALSELERRPLELPAGLSVTWLGVAGFLLTFEGHTLVVDPYLSRISLREFLRRQPALPDRSLVEPWPAPARWSVCWLGTRTSTMHWTSRR